MSTDTIAAISTAPGRAAISVVRLSGPEAIGIVDNLFSGKDTLARTRSHSVRHGKLRDPSGRVLDEVLVTVMKAPDTYTGEDVVEISCHGGILVSQLVLQALVEGGCRLAEPGEFTRRAFLNNRIDLAQAEAVAEIVAVKTRKAAERAMRQLEGELSERLRSIRASVVKALADVEARIDFPEDVPEKLETCVLCEALDKSIASIEDIISERVSFGLLSAGARIPVVGSPNVGKSSLFNAIVGRSRVIVSHLPGTTRDTVEEEIEIEGVPVRIVDTAGLRSSEEELEEEGVRRTMEELRVADLVILVMDASGGASKSSQSSVLTESETPGAAAAREPSAGLAAAKRTLSREVEYWHDIHILNLIGEKPHLIVINKIDIASPAAARSALETRSREAYSATACPGPVSLPQENSEIVEVSATQGTGIDELKGILASRLTAADLELQDASSASQRHVDSLRSAVENMRSAGGSLESGAPEELVAFELREAAQQLGSITGESIGPEILDSIFSRFCIGK